MKNKYLINFNVLYGNLLLNCNLITETLKDIYEQMEEHFKSNYPLYNEVVKTSHFMPYSYNCYELHEVDPDVEVIYMIEEEKYQ